MSKKVLIIGAGGVMSGADACAKLAAGADLGGARAVLLMQSSGVGNCINA